MLPDPVRDRVALRQHRAMSVFGCRGLPTAPPGCASWDGVYPPRGLHDSWSDGLCEQIFHGIQTRRSAGEELRGVEGASGESITIQGPVTQLDRFAWQTEHDRMFAW